MGDIGVGQQNVCGISVDFLGGVEPLFHCPQLARPPIGQRLSGHHAQALGRCGVSHLGGAIVAVVVDHDYRNGARVILFQQGLDRTPDGRRLVAGRDNADHTGPGVQIRGRISEALIGPPKTAAQYQYADPEKQGNGRHDQACLFH